ncbi:MAG: GntR family transcriptional regulator [Devosia sp.]|uniref:GntR family transcriptional regulator n=1 Tax=Devosia sp. TaxID=1871048 RepID=UPI001AC9253A|nr:GntR family transcriptional regulator [Devosia sp.]MBN9310748.1 GntR family transcriptional regulator [Devosia sp.]MBN9315509.1 GntR family transcriptional regulator [Devosia sp.]
MTIELELAHQPVIAGTRQTSISLRVYDAVRNAIVQLQLLPGHLLSEAELARQMGVSRQPVREAFIKLAENGLVEVRPQRGTFVKLISIREVQNSRFIRESIELAVVRKAAGQIGASGVAELRQLLAAQQVGLSGRLGDFMRLDDDFHCAIAAHAGVEHAWRHIVSLKAQLDRVRYLGFPAATPRPQVVAQHTLIVDALERNDAEGAVAMMHRHLNELAPSLPKLAEEHAELFAEE